VTLEFLSRFAGYPVSTNTFFEELLVLLRMPYRTASTEGNLICVTSKARAAGGHYTTVQYPNQRRPLFTTSARYRFPLRIFETNRGICSTDQKRRFPENGHFPEHLPTLNNY
jgi:hypothetical protein